MQIQPTDNQKAHLYRYGEKVEDSHKNSLNAVDHKKDPTKPQSEKTDGVHEPQDEYIPNGDDSDRSAGIYQLLQDNDNKQKIVFTPIDANQENEKQPEKAAGSDSNNTPPEKVNSSKDNKDGEDKQGTFNTDQVDREINKLKEEKKQIEQELKSNQNDEKKQKELKQRLAQVESELMIKDNDAYRKQNATFSSN